MSIEKQAHIVKLAESFFPKIRKLINDYPIKYPTLNTLGYEPTIKQIELKIDQMYSNYNTALSSVFITKIAENLEKDAENNKFINEIMKK